MIERILVSTVLGVAFLSAPVFADHALAQAKGCMACHQVEAKLVGPAYKEVAAKYKADANAASALAGKIKAGGTGVWGAIPMPPQPMLSDDEAAKLAAWVMSF